MDNSGLGHERGHVPRQQQADVHDMHSRPLSHDHMQHNPYDQQHHMHLSLGQHGHGHNEVDGDDVDGMEDDDMDDDEEGGGPRGDEHHMVGSVGRAMAATQLTLSYQGEVYVFDTVPPEKVCVDSNAVVSSSWSRVPSREANYDRPKLAASRLRALDT